MHAAALNHPPDGLGYPSLAHWTAAIPGCEGYVFRKFDRLSARNLFHLESEIARLEYRLDVLDKKLYEGSANERVEKQIGVYNWMLFEKRARKKGSAEHRRMKLIRLISLKLKQYHEMLLLQSQIAALQSPGKSQLRIVRDHFKGPDDYNGRYTRKLGGLDHYRLDSDHDMDLVALKPPAEDDLLSRFLHHHGWIKPTKIGDLEYVNQGYISRVAAIVTAILAMLLLLGAIVTLRLAHVSNDVRLVLIVAFTVAFALSLGLLTNAKRGEVLAGTAAYAAVLVVFVSSDLGAG